MAAGSSSRLGRPKQLLPWRDSSLIVNEIQKSLSIKELTTFVVLGANFELIEKEITHLPVEIVYNKDWKSGMGGSISFGIKYIFNKDFDGVLITLVDQPLIDKDHLTSLILKFNENHNMIIATSVEDRIGVPAIFPVQYFEELIHLSKDYGARYLIRKYKDHIITIDGRGKSNDIDTMEQYKTLLQRVKE